jgi:hypothetical protein
LWEEDYYVVGVSYLKVTRVDHKLEPNHRTVCKQK